VRATALVGVLALGLAACSGLPRSSDVMPGDSLAPALPTPVRMRPATPMPGASPEAIVRGFLVAGSALSDDDRLSGPPVSQDYRPAREFLTPAVSEGWAPGSRAALIYTTVATTMVASDERVATVRATAREVATLDATGRYAELPGAVPRSVDITVSRVDGEWRISRLPEDFGLWLDLFYFNKSYQPFTVAYASPIARTLIPDRRFFPITSGLPTALARAQLAPIPGYLQGAVVTGFPTNTKLSVDSVTVRSGTARLDLTAAAVTSGAEERRAALAQSIVTMTQATGVAGVALQAEGSPLDPVGVAGPPYDLSSLGFERAQGPEPAWVVLRNGDRLWAVRPADLRKADAGQSGPQLPRVNPNYSKLAVAPDLRELAAVTGDGTALYRFRQSGESPATGQSAQQTPFGTDLVRPAFDTHQGLWLAGVGAAGAPTIWVIDTRGEIGRAEPRPLNTPWLGAQRVVALKVAPDAQRVALLLRGSDGRIRIGVAGVLRGQDQRAVGLTEPLTVGAQVIDATDLTWTSAYRLSVLGRVSAAQDVRATSVELDGRTEGSELPAIPGAQTIIPLGGGRIGIVAGAGLFASVAVNWQDPVAVTDAVVP